jgi:hypothetical protein
VQKDIAKGIVTPGKYFVLKFDFSKVDRSPNLIETNESLKENMARSFQNFYTTYAMYLGEDANKLFENINPRNPAISLEACTGLVLQVLSNARKTRDKQLSSVQGVSNSLPLNNSPQLLILKLALIDLLAR